MANIYITMTGRSIWSILNTYYCVLMQSRFIPDKVVVFSEEFSSIYNFQDRENILEGLRITSGYFGLEVEIEVINITDEEDKTGCSIDFVNAASSISLFVKEQKQAGNVIALDITPGRKTLVAGALVPMKLEEVDHLFYLAIQNLKAAPYMMIPFQQQHLHDFKKEVREVVDAK